MKGRPSSTLWLFTVLALLLPGCLDPTYAAAATATECTASGRHFVACALFCKGGDRLEAIVEAEDGVRVSISIACGGSLLACVGNQTCETQATHDVAQPDEGECIGGFPRVADRWRVMTVTCRSGPDVPAAEPAKAP